MDDDSVVTAVIVDDHEVVSEGVRSWCAGASPRIELVAAGASIEAAESGRGADADVVILDLQLGTLPRSELTALQCLIDTGRSVVIYTQDHDSRTAVRCIRLGALSYVAKSEGKAHLVAAVHHAARGETYTPPTLSGALAADDDPARPRLAPKEIEALRRWFTSSSKVMAAKSLHISVKTLDTYITRARIKYATAGRSAPTKSELVARALEDGIITLDELRATES